MVAVVVLFVIWSLYLMDVPPGREVIKPIIMHEGTTPANFGIGIDTIPEPKPTPMTISPGPSIKSSGKTETLSNDQANDDEDKNNDVDDDDYRTPNQTAANASPTASAGLTIQSPASSLHSPSSSKPSSVSSDRPLILYAYFETVTARANLEFFIAHGLHAAADFIFIMNGEGNATGLIPNETNIKYVQRENDCYDLGAYAEVLTKDDLWKKYGQFIMLNASIRGPFLPYWAEACWSDMYLKRVTEEVKLVGMTANCWPSFHVQSMIWATDTIGLSILLSRKGIHRCFHSWESAVSAEIGASALIKLAGYKLDVMMSLYHSKDKNEDGNEEKDGKNGMGKWNGGSGSRYENECDSSDNGDVLWDGEYAGINVHPYETIFLKSNRDISPVVLTRLTEWTKGRGYSSYDFCKG
jgi:hypothetical protein